MTENKNMKIEGRKPHPSKHDPLEQRIRQLIREHVLSTPLGKESLEKVNDLQIDYFRGALRNLDKPELVYEDTQKLLKELAAVTHSKIVEGEELLDRLPKGKPVFAVLNHFSAYKLTTIEPQTIGLSEKEMNIENGEYTEEIYPFPIFYAPLEPVAERLGDNLSDAHLAMPGQHLKRVQAAAGLIVVPEERRQFQLIKQRTADVIAAHPNSLMVIFPEGETSGKRNEGTPFDTVGFHSGVWGITTELAKEGMVVPIITAYQYWNPKSGFEVGIVDLWTPSPETTREEQDQQAETSREKMQKALDVRMGRERK